MKKIYKILIIIVSVLVGIYVIIAVIISPIAKNYIEKHSKELCGRTVTMDRLRINIFTGSVSVVGFNALENNDSDSFFAFDTLKVNMNLFRLFSSELRFQEITLVSPHVNIWQRDSIFNFDDVIAFFDSGEETEEAPDTTESPLAIDIRNITLKKGNILYRDLGINSQFDLQDLSLFIPHLYFSGHNTDVGLNLNFGRGGDLSLHLLYAMDKSTYFLNAKLNNFKLESVLPYLQQSLHINSFAGLLSADIVVSGDVDHIMDIEAKGDVHVSDVQMMDARNEELVGIKHLDVAIQKVNLKENAYLLDTIALSGLRFHYQTKADSTNSLTNLFVESTPEESTETMAVDSLHQSTDSTAMAVADTVPLQFNIAHFLMSESQVTYSDYSLKQELDFSVNNITVNANNLSLTDEGDLSLSAILGEGGELTGKWKGRITDLSQHRLYLTIRNMKLPNISPYCVHYTAYPIKEGLLSFTSETTIKDSKINSLNEVDIYKCHVDDKLKEVKPEYNIPLKAGLYILADRDDKIKMELPVEGDLDDPNFSYKKIIFKTLGNLIIKVAASPIDFLIDAFGASKETFGDMELLPSDVDINAENFDRLNKIADIIKEKNELILTLQQSIDTIPTLRNLALFQAKRDFYFKNNPQPADERLMLADIKNIFSIKDNNKDLIAFIDAKSDSIVSGNTYEKAYALYDQQLLKDDLERATQRRYELFTHYFNNQGVAEENIKILPMGDKKPPLGKIYVTFGVQVSETEGGADGTVYEEIQ